MEDPSAWSAADVRANENWIYTLSSSDITEIDLALEFVKALNVRKEVWRIILLSGQDQKYHTARKAP